MFLSSLFDEAGGYEIDILIPKLTSSLHPANIRLTSMRNYTGYASDLAYPFFIYFGFKRS